MRNRSSLIRKLGAGAEFSMQISGNNKDGRRRKMKINKSLILLVN